MDIGVGLAKLMHMANIYLPHGTPEGELLHFGTGLLMSSNFRRPTNNQTKGPVKLIKQVKIAHSFLPVCLKSVPRYHFKLDYAVLQMAVKEFSKTTSKNGEIGHFNRSLHTEPF